MTPAERWHRIGIGMSLAALVAFLVMGGYLLATIPSNWHVVTRHSDIPEQVIEGVTGLEAEIERLHGEIDFRLKEIDEASARSLRKVEDARAGKGESGETVDAARRERMLTDEAPRWERAAEAARTAAERIRAR
jgi:hypothetical protein